MCKGEWCLGRHSLRTASGKTLVLTSNKCAGKSAASQCMHAAAEPLELAKAVCISHYTWDIHTHGVKVEVT